jgi:hypothetical protein
MLRLTWIVVGIFALWNAAAAASDSDNLPHWSYSQGEGPERWAELSPDFKICGEGREQSLSVLRINPVCQTASGTSPTRPPSIHIDGEARRPGAAPLLSRPMMGEAQLFCPLANLGGTCGLDPNCNIGRSPGEADADAPG